MGIIKDGKYEELSNLDKLIDKMGSPGALLILLFIGFGPLLYLSTFHDDGPIGGGVLAYGFVVTFPCIFLVFALVIGHLTRGLINLGRRDKK